MKQTREQSLSNERNVKGTNFDLGSDHHTQFNKGQSKEIYFMKQPLDKDGKLDLAEAQQGKLN